MVKPYVKDGKLVVLGIVQEQHPARTKLYRQWKKFDWPILVDSLNLYDVSAVPIPVAIDEEGIVRHARAVPDTYIHQFVKQSRTIDVVKSLPPPATRPTVGSLLTAAQKTGTAQAWRKLGDTYFQMNGNIGLDRAIEFYQKAIGVEGADGRSHFRLGVALRRRSETSLQHSGDAQLAVVHWGRALDVNPNQYIWRRRIQQYGPRLDKPYNFYFWVKQAREEIAMRGEIPVRLHVEPTGSEITAPSKHVSLAQNNTHPQRDPDGRISRDQKEMVQIDTVVTPVRVRPGHWVRAQVRFQLNKKTSPYWNNEARGLYVWVDLPNGFELGEGSLTLINPARPETREPRTIEIEIKVDKRIPTGSVHLPAYALYYVCRNKGGQCVYKRQDFTIDFDVDEKATPIK